MKVRDLIQELASCAADEEVKIIVKRADFEVGPGDVGEIAEVGYHAIVHSHIIYVNFD